MSDYPTDWIYGSIGDIAMVVSGYAFPSSDFHDRQHEGMPVIRMSDIQENGLNFNTAKRVSNLSQSIADKFRIRTGDLLFGMSGSIEKSILVSHSCEALLNQRVGALRPHQDNGNFHAFVFQSDIVKNQILDLAAGGAQLNISAKQVESIQIPIPPLPEQKKITEILSGIDQQIANQQNKASKWLHLHQGILDLLMTQGTRGRAVVDTDAGKVPDNWKIGRVEDFFALGRGRVISIPYIKDHPGPYPVFSSQSKNNGEMGRMDTYDFDGDYFTWTTDGAYAGSVFARSGRFNCTNVCGTGRAKSPDEADTKFAAYFLQRVAKGHVSYVGNPKLMNNTFAEIPFALPPIDEQSEINEIIDSARRNIDLIESQILSLSNLKKSVSSDLLSGRKRVSV